MAADVVHQGPDVRIRAHDDEQHHLGGHPGEHHGSVLMLEDGHLEDAGGRRGAQFVGTLENRGDVGGHLLTIEARIGVIVDEQPVAAENGSGRHAVKAAKGRNELTNRGQPGLRKGVERSVRPATSKSSAYRLIHRWRGRYLSRVHTSQFVQRVRHRAALVAAFAVAALVGCGPDPFAPRADGPTVDTNFQIWAITGSPVPYPTAFAVPQRATVRLDPSGTFDIAFDITPEGKLQVLPVAKVISSLAGTRSIGIIVSDSSYSQIASAPTSGWAADSIVELQVGQAFILQVTTQFCQFNQRQVIYGKFRVDSILPDERRARLRGRVNPNCGFRSFADGTPEF